MAAPERVSRVSQAVQQVLANLLLREVKDPRLQHLTITEVVVSRDLAHAKIYFSLPGDRLAKEAALKALKKANGFLRHRLGEEIDLRVTPSLAFFIDSAVESGSRIDQLLKNI